MNLLAFSNICNIIAQQAGFLGYHFGFESEINGNIRNNLNPQNAVGNRYPFCLLEFPTTQTEISNAQITTTFAFRINFFTPQGRDSAGDSLGTTTYIEQIQDLSDKVLLFFNFMYQCQKNRPSFEFVFAGSSYSGDIQLYQHNDKLIQIAHTFKIQIKEACPLVGFDPLLVLPPYSVPVSDSIDYERLEP